MLSLLIVIDSGLLTEIRSNSPGLIYGVDVAYRM